MTQDEALTIAVIELKRQLDAIDLSSTMFGVADLMSQRRPVAEAIKIIEAMIAPPTLGITVEETIKSSERLG